MATHIKTARTRYGDMRYFADDKFIGRSLELYGEYSEEELVFLRKLVKPGWTVLDIGANIGTLTVPFSRMVGEDGMVHAYEPQPQNYDLLGANIKGLSNVVAHGHAIGEREGVGVIPALHVLPHTNYGEVMVHDRLDGIDSTPVAIRAIDDLGFDKVDFIKLDVEGYEARALEGARKTIEAFRPLLYVENDPRDANQSSHLLSTIRSLGYRIYQHSPRLFNEHNLSQNPDNVFGNIASTNVLAIPKEKREEYRDITGFMSPIVPASPLVGNTGWAGIVRLGGVGDDLIAASVLRPLKKMGYKIDVISKKPQSCVFENNPFIDKLSIKEDKDLPQGDLGAWQNWFHARGKEYDLFVNLSHSCEGTHALFPAMSAYWWPEKYRRRKFDGSYVETVHDIVGVPYDFGPLFFPTEEELDMAHETRRKIKAEKVICWCISGTRIDKVYPQTPMVIGRMIKELGCAVVMVGAPPPAKDYSIAKQVQDHVEEQNGSLENLHCAMTTDDGVANWPIRRILTFASICDLVIGPDTGPMWSVAFEQMPKILLHSHASVDNITKNWVNTVSLHADQERVPCWPCHRLHDGPETCVVNKHDNGAKCVTDISTELVLTAASSAMGLGLPLETLRQRWPTQVTLRSNQKGDL